MKKLLLQLLAILLFTACQKEISKDKLPEEVASTTSKTSTKITVCHHDALTGKNKTILINPTAWPEHQAHGDLQGDCSEVIVTICGKDWMKRNLDLSTYRDGTSIPEEKVDGMWGGGLTTGAWCNYNNDPAKGAIYGKLYNWYAVNGDIDGDGIKDKELAPSGWHVPTDAEWTDLENCLGGSSVAGGKLKSTGTLEEGNGLWLAPNNEATNSSGFTVLPGGFRSPYSEFINIFGAFWTSSEGSSEDSWVRGLGYFGGYVSRGFGQKFTGFSVRCIRD